MLVWIYHMVLCCIFFYVKIYKFSIIKPVIKKKHLNENIREQTIKYWEQYSNIIATHRFLEHTIKVDGDTASLFPALFDCCTKLPLSVCNTTINGPFLPKNQSPPLANLFVYPYRLLQVKKSVILVYFYNHQFVSIFGVRRYFHIHNSVHRLVGIASLVLANRHNRSK